MSLCIVCFKEMPTPPPRSEHGSICPSCHTANRANLRQHTQTANLFTNLLRQMMTGEDHEDAGETQQTHEAARKDDNRPDG